MHAERENFIRLLNAFDDARAKFYQGIPHESANELQYMLNHLMHESRPGLDDAERIRRATGHLRRAYFDYLKMAIYEVHSQITISRPQYLSEFLKRMLAAKTLEFSNIGGEQDDAFAAYCAVLEEFVPKMFTTQLQPASRYLVQRGTFPDAARASESTTLRYMEWAKLEMLLAAIANNRFPKLILLVVEAYYTKTLPKDLPYIIAITKGMIINEFFKNESPDAMKRLGTQVFADSVNQESYQAFLAAREAITKDMPAEAKGAARAKLIDAVEQPFTTLMRYFDINLEDYPIEFANHCTMQEKLPASAGEHV